MAKRTFDYDILDCGHDQPIVFTGPPGHLRGRLPLHNGGDQRAVLRHVNVSGGPLALAATAPLRTTVLRPNDAARPSVRISVDDSTPPGDYECEVEVGGSVRQALLRVVERIHVVMSPAVLYIENSPDAKITKRVLVANRGNVPIHFGHPGGIALDDERVECRVTRATIDVLGRELEAIDFARMASARSDDQPDDRDGHGDQMPGGPALTIERAFGEAVRQGNQYLASVRPLGVRNAYGVTTIEGGDEVPVDLNVRLPAGLDQHTRYIGIYPFYDADLEFVIVPGPRANEPNEPNDQKGTP